MKPIAQGSNQWLNEHHSDPYVQKAKKDGYRSRAAYKLLELQDKYHLFTPNMHVIELGAAPGSWTQILSNIMGTNGHIYALDLLSMDPLPNCTFIQGDFTEDQTYDKLCASVEGDSKIQWVISDMAPNMSGNRAMDQDRSSYLVELAIDFALKTLPNNGHFLTKAFHGSGYDENFKLLKSHFKSVSVKKPKASRERSSEVYWIAKNFINQ